MLLLDHNTYNIECNSIQGHTFHLYSELVISVSNFFFPCNIQVQFEEREDTKTCTVIINNDGIFEGPIGEDFLLELSMPTFALLGDPSLTVVTILDAEDGRCNRVFKCLKCYSQIGRVCRKF